MQPLWEIPYVVDWVVAGVGEVGSPIDQAMILEPDAVVPSRLGLARMAKGKLAMTKAIVRLWKCLPAVEFAWLVGAFEGVCRAGQPRLEMRLPNQ